MFRPVGSPAPSCRPASARLVRASGALVLAFPLLAACANPPIIDPVEEQLALRVVNKAATPLRLLAATAGLIAETCPVEDVEGYFFRGGGATALNINGPAADIVKDGSGNVRWTFNGVGVDNQSGDLIVDTTGSHTSFDVVYTTNQGTTTMQVAMTMIRCEPTGAPPSGPAAPPAKVPDTGDTGADTGADTGDTGTDTGDTGTDTGDTGETGETGDTGAVGVGFAVVGGTGVFVDSTQTDGTAQIEIKGSPPYAGLGFSPVYAEVPFGGYENWANAATHEGLLLDDVTGGAGGAGIDIAAGTWSGTASDSTWTRATTIPFP